MEKKFKRTTVTSALPYANGPVHIGHLAGVYVPADIYARYLRLKKEDVLFIGGSDEHGVPITIRAKNSAFRSMYTAAPLRRRIMSWLRISLRRYTTKESLSKKHPNNITTKKRKHSSPTVTSPVSVLTAIRKVPMATNARNAEPPCRPPI